MEIRLSAGGKCCEIDYITIRNSLRFTRRELMQMLHTRRKAEIEVLHSLPTTTPAFEELCRGADINPTSVSSSPLIAFVIGKINSALSP